jgi:hypothetical protein
VRGGKVAKGKISYREFSHNGVLLFIMQTYVILEIYAEKLAPFSSFLRRYVFHIKLFNRHKLKNSIKFSLPLCLQYYIFAVIKLLRKDDTIFQSSLKSKNGILKKSRVDNFKRDNLCAP